MSKTLTKDQENELRYIRAMVEQYGYKAVTEAEFERMLWYMGNLEWNDYIRIVEPVLKK